MREMPACDYQPPVYDGPSKAEVLATRQQYCNPALFTYYKEPLMLVDGHMQYLFDETGVRYLDLFAGIVTVSCGHCHPKILERTQNQMNRLQHATTIYLHPNLGELAKRLAAKMPNDLESTYIVNSGSEANELAIMMARLYTGHYEVIALRNSYHGGTPGTLGLSSHHTWKFPLPQAHGVVHVKNPDPYRNSNPDPYDVEDAIRYSTSGHVAAFIAEPFQGMGGVTSADPTYLQKVYEIIRQYGGICIADEVQTGFGRTGDHFWGFQNFGVEPDMVTMAKGLGNGVPIAAVTTRREVAEALTQRIHFNTFGGNPVSVAQAIAVLDVIEEEGLQANARAVGGHCIEGLQRLMTKHTLIGDVRGNGLMIGVELVRDRTTKEPATEATLAVHETLRERGILIGKTGIFGNILRIKPPLCVSKEDIDFALDVLDEVLGEV